MKENVEVKYKGLKTIINIMKVILKKSYLSVKCLVLTDPLTSI